MTKDEVTKLRMNSPESLQFLNNATKFYNLMMMYRCAIREIQTKLEVLDDEFSVENNRNPISFIKRQELRNPIVFIINCRKWDMILQQRIYKHI